MRLMKVLVNKDIKSLARVDNIWLVQGYENVFTLRRVVPSLAALAGKSGEVEEMLGKVDGLEMFMNTDFQRHLERRATQACACISCGLHTLDDPIPCPRRSGGHDVGCEGCAAGINIFTTLDALMMHSKARGAQVPSVLLVEQSDELVDVAGNIAECLCRFKHFRAHLAQLVVKHDFDLEESKDQKQDKAIVIIDYKVRSIEEEERRRMGA